MAPSAKGDDASLKRLGGGRWQTRDERFTIEPESGTWVVVDAEQTDDLGLPLVRGPFRSLADAKDAIATARSSPPAASPLAGRVARGRAEPRSVDGRPSGRAARTRVSGERSHQDTADKPAAARRRKAASGRSNDSPKDETQAEPRWFSALDADARRQARRLVTRLEDAGAPDPEGMARRDIVGGVAAVAGYAIKRRLTDLGPDADAWAVGELIADGRDEELGVRWHLVDGDGRPISIDLDRRPLDRRRSR
jgi:hypothetical protein